MKRKNFKQQRTNNIYSLVFKKSETVNEGRDIIHIVVWGIFAVAIIVGSAILLLAK